MSTKKQMDELIEEVRRLREEVQRANAWPGIQYVPQPYYVPWYPAPYQPYTPWWQSGNTLTITNCPPITGTYLNNAVAATAAYTLPDYILTTGNAA